VGLQLALELQQCGVRYLAIDQRPYPDSFCKALGVTLRADLERILVVADAR